MFSGFDESPVDDEEYFRLSEEDIEEALPEGEIYWYATDTEQAQRPAAMAQKMWHFLALPGVVFFHKMP